MSIALGMDERDGEKQLRRQCSCNLELEHPELGSLLRSSQATSRRHRDKAWMSAIRAINLKPIQDNRDHCLRVSGLVRQLGQDVQLFCFSISSTDLDGDIAGSPLVMGQPSRRECAVAKLVNDAVAVLETVVDVNRMVAVSFVVFNVFDILDIVVLEGGG